MALKARTVLFLGAAAVALVQAPAANAQEQQQNEPADNQTSDNLIVVTAQKREQSINDVGLSITAASAETLQERGIIETADLAKIVPGLSFTEASGGQPVYTIRGVGLFDIGLASAPAVAIYSDQVPLATPNMTTLPPFDIERVEVLKGPQGTLFGASSTGGAINYIAAKPTSFVTAGFDATYERFDHTILSGYVSGPISDELRARFAARVERGGAWQYSLSRPDDRLGAQRNVQVRGIVDWAPTDTVALEMGVTYGNEQSDTQARQFIENISPNQAALAPAFVALDPAPDDSRAADWNPDKRQRADDHSLISYLRADIDIAPGTTITSLTSYQDFDQSKPSDQAGFVGPSLAGAAGPAFYALSVGEVNNFNQELRIAGDIGDLTYTIGGTYDHKDVVEATLLDTSLTINQPVPFVPPYRYVAGSIDQTIEEYGVFGSFDYQLTDNIVAHAGVRYTNSSRSSINCTYDYFGDGVLGNVSAALQTVFQMFGLKNTPVVAPGTQCVSLTPAPDLTPDLDGTLVELDEDNVSWKLGLDYKTDGGTLFYASANRGYKAGIISVFTAASTADFIPATQERLDAFELGFKAPLANGAVQLNGAAFYYIYDDKQLRTVVVDPVFGPQNRLVNIPESTVFGLEADLQAEPVPGLSLALSGTYLDTEVTESFLSFNFQQNFGDFEGSELPYTSKWQISSDIEYEWDLNDGLLAFVGGGYNYRSKQNATFDTPSAPAPAYEFPGYGLLDLRAGIGSSDGDWRLTAFGKNVTDEFYITSKYEYADYRTRTTGMTATYGVRLSVNY